MAGLTYKDWQDAELSQQAVNPSGLIKSLAEVTPRVWEDLWAQGIGDTEHFRKHPIIRLYVAQINFLCWDQEPDFDKYYQTMEEWRHALASARSSLGSTDPNAIVSKA